MKIIWKLFLLALIMALAAPFIITARDGEPVVTPKDMLPGLEQPLKTVISDIKAFASPKASSGEIDSGTITSDGEGMLVYRWRDKQGRWRFSDEENPAGESERVLIKMSSKTEGMAPTSGESNAGIGGQGDQQVLEAIIDDLEKLPLPVKVSREELDRLIEDAGALQALMDDYGRSLDSKQAK